MKYIKIASTALLIIIVAGAIAAAGYFYVRYEKIRKNPDLISKEEIKTITDGIMKFMELPTDEEPTLATVTDKEKLKDQDFFKKTENGDKILIYATARKAILYRPSTGRVVEFAPLLIGDGTDQTTQPIGEPQTKTKSSVATVSIYNGTDVLGLTGEVEAQLAGVNDILIVSKINAAKKDYSQSLVLDLSGKYSDLASDIAKKVNGKLVSVLPEGENKPSSDILIIAGKSR